MNITAAGIGDATTSYDAEDINDSADGKKPKSKGEESRTKDGRAS